MEGVELSGRELGVELSSLRGQLGAEKTRSDALEKSKNKVFLSLTLLGRSHLAMLFISMN